MSTTSQFSSSTPAGSLASCLYHPHVHTHTRTIIFFLFSTVACVDLYNQLKLLRHWFVSKINIVYRQCLVVSNVSSSKLLLLANLLPSTTPNLLRLLMLPILLHLPSKTILFMIWMEQQCREDEMQREEEAQCREANTARFEALLSRLLLSQAQVSSLLAPSVSLGLTPSMPSDHPSTPAPPKAAALSPTSHT